MKHTFREGVRGQLREVLGSAGLNLLATPKSRDSETPARERAAANERAAAQRGSERESAVTDSHVEGIAGPRGRIVRAHGPIVLSLAALSTLSMLVSVAAVIFMVISLNTRVDRNLERLDIQAAKTSAIQASRVESATDTCRRLRSLVQVAFGSSGRAEGQVLIRREGLDHCTSTARKQTAVHHLRLPHH